ncbi:MAG: sulfotransferase [Thermodesulfobacteriota bacterium]
MTLNPASTFRSGARPCPAFLVVGAQRAGTTSLYMCLKEHPQLFLPRIKEPAFFAFHDGEIASRYGRYLVNTPFVTDWQRYQELFAEAGPARLTGECSPEYLFFHDKAIATIRQHVADWQKLKIIAILRHPVDRALSHFQFVAQTCTEELDFLAALKAEDARLAEGRYPMRYGYKTVGCYSRQLQAYVQTFSQVKVVLFEDFVARPDLVLGEVYRFLGVDDSFRQELAVNNASGVCRYPLLKPFYELLFGDDNLMRNAARHLLSDEARVRIRNHLFRWLSKNDRAMSRVAYEHLTAAFAFELRALCALLDGLGVDYSSWTQRHRLAA